MQVFNKFQQNFGNFHSIVMEHEKFKISEEKQKNIFNNNFPKIQFTLEIAKVKPIFGHKINFAENIWKQTTQTEMTNGS